MKYYFAPMEGITGYIYRNAHLRFFSPADCYYTPFLVPNQNRKFTPRERNDILPEHNEGLSLVPQLLTNHAEDFIWAAKELKKLGYEEVNLNLGCPSGTVVSKGRGAGFLAEPEKLNEFFYEVFSALDQKISVKTRIGVTNPEEFCQLLEVFQQYPIKELIIHPRVQKDFYKNEPNLSVFKTAVSLSKIPLCYNGNLFSADDIRNFSESFPTVDRVMLGRGLIANPGLIEEAREGRRLEKAKLKAFHDQLLADYEAVMSGDRNVLFKMKELWAYLIQMFEDGDRYGKQIRKASRIAQYKQVVNSLFLERELKPLGSFKAKAS